VNKQQSLKIDPTTIHRAPHGMLLFFIASKSITDKSEGKGGKCHNMSISLEQKRGIPAK
jgi:hypothetical protein